jgi:WhiB family redox-sensing transcriptional regulator
MAHEWMDRALCLGADPEDWFPIGNTGSAVLQAEEAKKVCATCGVRGECLTYALEGRFSYGIFGGVDEVSRTSIERGRQRGYTTTRRTDLLPVAEATKLIDRCGLNNKEIAQRTGVHNQTVSAIRRGLTEWVEPETYARLKDGLAAVTT